MEDQCEILKDAAGNILVDANGYVTCESKEGVKFQLKYNEIDFDFDMVQCTIGGKDMLIQLRKPLEQTGNDDDDANVSTNINRDALNDEQDGEESAKRVSFSWNDAESMAEHGYGVSAVQVENKFKSLERSYKNMILNNKKTRRGRVGCPYEYEHCSLKIQFKV